MAVLPRLDAVFCYPTLCIKRRYGDLVHAHSVHLVALTPQVFHLVHELLPLTERFFVVLVGYLLLNHIFFHALRLPYVFFAHFHRVHLGPHCYDFLYHFSPTFIFHLAQNLLISAVVKRMVLGVVACVISHECSCMSLYTSSVWMSKIRLSVSVKTSSHLWPYLAFK